jgi:hypothetical protein
VVEEFSTQIQDDVDLEQMQAALLSAAQETMQPQRENKVRALLDGSQLVCGAVTLSSPSQTTL